MKKTMFEEIERKTKREESTERKDFCTKRMNIRRV